MTDLDAIPGASADVDGRRESDRVPQLAFVENATWEHVGRTAVAGELGEARHDVDGSFRDLASTLRGGEELTEQQVRDARVALNQARRVLEEHVATVADGAGAWGDPVPSMPYGVYKDVVDR